MNGIFALNVGIEANIQGENPGARPSSLPDLKEIGRKPAWPVHISPLSWAIKRLLPGETVKTMSRRDGIPWGCPRPVEFSLRFFKSDRLLGFG